jgi:hypothetical protein
MLCNIHFLYNSLMLYKLTLNEEVSLKMARKGLKHVGLLTSVTLVITVT